jgi:hypothetical protein
MTPLQAAFYDLRPLFIGQLDTPTQVCSERLFAFDLYPVHFQTPRGNLAPSANQN